MEHLFKLTRADFKAVSKEADIQAGYLNLEGANPCYGLEIGSYPYGAYEFQDMLKDRYGSNFSLSDLDAHPFVTKDKNDKDVFAGDKIKGIVETIFEDEHPVVGYVDYMSDFMGWSLDMPDLGISIYLETVEDIELIEDKEE